MADLRWAILGLLPLLVGCFPIELDVSKDGKILLPRQEGFFSVDPATGKAAKLYAPEKGKPVWARWAPDGKSILAVVNADGNFDFAIVTPADGKARNLFSKSNTTYARFSPDGQALAVCRVADDKKAPMDENMPELIVAQVKDGTAAVVSANVSSLCRWFPDSKRILAFQIKKKDEKQRYEGDLVSLDVATKQAKVLAAGIGSKDVFFDLSPDGNKVLLTAYAAGAAGAALKAGDDAKAKLFLVDLATGATRAVDKEVEFAVWSPDGKKVLVAGTTDKDGGRALEVSDETLAEFKPIATDAAVKVGGMGNDATVYAVWLNPTTICYLARKAVYGTAGVNMELAIVGADGKGRRNLQTLVDAEAEK